ncbi:MAG: hypothetical protein PQJ50_11100 [Spirochaetales bacterium]|nr:hypothetical protein [Spirochaetales bacterium]
MDLRGRSMNNPIPLKGEWEFYWMELLTPSDFRQNINEPVDYYSVPGIWNGEAVSDGPRPAEGYGTFRITVLVDDPALIYAVKLREVLTAYRLWVNGRELLTAGAVGKNSETTTPRYTSDYSTFTAESGSIELILQISNFDYKDG